MTRSLLKDAIVEELLRLAPETDPRDLSLETRLRDDLDLDSFDLVRFVTALDDRLHVDVPEADYGRLQTVGSCLEYLAARLEPGPAVPAAP